MGIQYYRRVQDDLALEGLAVKILIILLCNAAGRE